MALRMSTLFLRTLREDPADAEVPSHRLLVRAGYIRRVSPGIYTWLPLGLRVLRNVERIVREEMDAIGAQELLFPALLPREPYEATGRWTEYGDNIFRLKDRKGADYLLGPTHEEMFTLAVKDLVLVLQGPAAVDLPDPDEVPRRGAAARRHAARARVRHEGLLLLRHRRRRARQGLPAAPRRLHPDLRPARLRLRHRRRRWPAPWAARKSEEFLATAENGEDTYVRCTQLRLRRQRRGRAGARPRRRAVRRRRLPPTPRTPPTPRRSTRWSTTSTRRSRATDRPWAAATPSRTSSSCSCTPTAPASRWPSACPATARSTRSGSAPRSSRPRSRPSTRRTSRPTRRWSRATSGPARSGAEGDRRGSATCSTPASSRAPAGSPAPTSRGRHVIDLVAGRDFTADGTIEAAEVRAGDACPSCGHGARGRPRHRDGPHLPARHASTPRRSTSRCSTRTASCVTVTMGSYGVGVSRAVACVAEGNHDELGLVWPRELAPADVHIVATGKDEAVFAGRRGARPPSSRRRASRCCTTTAEGVSPGVKFKDAELIGVPTIVVVGRGLAERRGRGQGPARPASGASVPVDEAVAEIVAEVRGTAVLMAGRRPTPASRSEAVIFDWGGTLTPWHTVDLRRAVAGLRRGHGASRPDDARLAAADAGRADPRGRGAARGSGPRTDHGSASSGRSSREAGVDADARRHEAGARGIPEVLGAAHLHRPAGAAALGGPARPRHSRGRAVQHDLEPRLPPRGVRARRRPRPGRRRRLLLRDRVDEAARRGLPRGVRGASACEPERGGLRRRPAVRGRPRAASRSGMRAIWVPHSRHPGGAAGGGRRRRRTRWPTSCSTSWPSSTAGCGR